MSKKLNQSNTILNYFSSPKSTVIPKNIQQNVSKRDSTPLKRKESNITSSNDDSDEDIARPIKRSRIARISSDSENESPIKSNNLKRKSGKQIFNKESSAESSDIDEPKTNKSQLDLSNCNTSLMGSYGFVKEDVENGELPKERKIESIKQQEKNLEETCWLHESLEFLKPDKIRDYEKRRPSDPEYDKRTLHVPQKYLDTLTPAMRQWWILKSQHLDCVLFFKVGKFYELYHMDAVVGVQQLGFSYMKNEFAHSGFPESAYDKMVTMLIEKGFKVARVEQTETPEMMADRCKKQARTTKYDKVVKREICQISTKASFVYGAQVPEARSEVGCYLFCVAAKMNQDSTCRFGICFVETSIGLFKVAEFEDDKYCSKLLAVFSEYPPGLILTEKGTNYGYFKNILNSQLKDVMQETLASKTQFYAAAATLENLYSSCYFKDKDGQVVWPELFKTLALECNPKPEYELALKSLGGIHWFLKNSELDIQVFSMGRFELYNSVEINTTSSQCIPIKREYMVLDSVTIKNLNLLGGKGTLQKTLDFCKTLFGKRALQLWICRPSCKIDEIISRQDAVNELIENRHQLQLAQNILKTLPDLERQVAKIHTYGNKFCATDHPDGRAILYEAKTYSKRKILDLLKTLKSFEASQKIAEIFKSSESQLLRKLTQFNPNGINIDLTKTLNFFKQAFDHAEAEKEGKIIPKSGVDNDYDQSLEVIQEINDELQEYLKEQSRYFGCKVSYFGSDKKRFQLEVPDNKASKANDDYQLESKKKGAKRFSTSVTRELLQRMMQAEAERNRIVLDLNRRIFEKFSSKYDQWQQVIYCLTVLDILCSLAEYATSYSGDICKPNVEQFSTQPFISIENGKHPCTLNIDNFVANDTVLGSQNSPLLLLTGPNMGGKSTLMRQVSVICVMAQMGSFVPASSCSLSLIDRVFTRIGACDDIVRGQSTFSVELTEASTILEHASNQSLVIIDELGRGTSTHDGNAIATACVEKLISMGCRTLFSTHYHSLVDYFIKDKNKNIQLGHMACMVENEDNVTEESVTLLYKLAEGRCPKSFGFNAAQLAGLPQKIVIRGRELAKEAEDEDIEKAVFNKIFGSDHLEIAEIRQMITALNL